MAAAPKLARMAWRNVVRNWRHSLATLLAIASGFMAVSLFDGFIRELEKRNKDGYETRGMLGDVLIQRKDAEANMEEDPWLYSLDEKDQAEIESFLKTDPAFLRRVRFLNVTGIASAGGVNAVVMGHGYDLAEGAAVRGERWVWNTVAGKPLHLPTAPRPAILLGRSLSRLLGCESGNPDAKDDFLLPDGNYVPGERPFTCKEPRVLISATTEMAQVNAIDLEVSGLFDAGFREADKRAISLSLEDAQRILDTKKITMVSVQLTDPSERVPFVRRMRAALESKGLKLDIKPWTEHKLAAYVVGGLELVGVFRNLFMAIVVTIGVMSVANTMMKSVNERIREIGTLRSLGFLRRELTFVFACEGFFLSMIACVAGLLGTLVVSKLIESLGLSYKAGVLSVPIRLSVGAAPGAWAVSAITLSLLATGTAWFCARRAASMVVADAMRHV